MKILDFGLAKMEAPQTGEVDTDAPTQKKIPNPGMVMGTVDYMSLEQVRGQEADSRSDILSFVVILYEMLSGRLWRRDGRELYYILADNKLMAVEVMLGEEVKYGTPKELFALGSLRVEATGRGYARTVDGQRFLFVTVVEETSLTPFTVVQNWMAEAPK